MARKLVVFGNVAVGPIAIGNIAVGYVAIGFTVAVGPIAIGLNSLGFLLAIGLNAAGVVDIAAVNGVGALTFAGVNGIGTLGHAFVNEGMSPLLAFVLGVGEALAAFFTAPPESQRPGTLGEGETARVMVKRIDEDGLLLAEGQRLRWSDEIPAAERVRLRDAASDAVPLFDVEARTAERPIDDAQYREAPHMVRERFVTFAKLVPVERWYLPVFRRALVAGSALAFAILVVSFLLH